MNQSLFCPQTNGFCAGDAASAFGTTRGGREFCVPGAQARRRGPVVFHDLRHTFGTLCASSGIPVGDIQAYMGHASPSTTEIYMHFAPKHDAAKRLTAAFGETSDRADDVSLTM